MKKRDAERERKRYRVDNTPSNIDRRSTCPREQGDVGRCPDKRSLRVSNSRARVHELLSLLFARVDVSSHPYKKTRPLFSTDSTGESASVVQTHDKN